MNTRILVYFLLFLILLIGVYAAESNMLASVQVLSQDCTKFSKSIYIYDSDNDLIQISGYGEICNSDGLAFKNRDNIGKIKSNSTKLTITNKGGGNFRTEIYGNIETLYGTSLSISGDAEFFSSSIDTSYLASFSMKNNLYGELTINADIGKASVGSVLGKFNANGNYLSSFSSKGNFSGNLNTAVSKFSAGNVKNSYIKSALSFSLKGDMINSDLDKTDKLSVKGKVDNSVIGEISNDISSFSARAISNSYVYANHLGKFSAGYGSEMTLLIVTLYDFSLKYSSQNNKISSFNNFYAAVPGMKKKLITQTETFGTTVFEIL